MEGRAQDVFMKLRYRLDADLRRSNAGITAGSDGLPLPPPELAYLADGDFSLAAYEEGGRRHAQNIRGMLSDAGLPVERAEDVLDFGCGTGRVLRHFAGLGPRLYGSDLNHELIEWCSAHLPVATFSPNSPEPPLSWPDSTFDIVYCISVYTHLPERLQHRWLSEHTRVLKPGGLLYFTTHGRSRRQQLSPGEREAFDLGEFVVQGGRYSFSNHCGTYHPVQWVRATLARKLEEVTFVEAVGTHEQDGWLFRRDG